MKKNRGKRIFVFVAVVTLLLCALVLYMDFRLSPIVEEMALARSRSIATGVVNESIYAAISEDGITYDDLISFEKDKNDKITALKTNLVKINSLKSKISADILRRLSEINETELSIPLGNLINGELLSGRGPKIQIKLVPVGTVSTEMKNEFNTAGINQTLHQIIVEVRLSVTVIMPRKNVSSDITSSVCIAQTVIVGDVPQAYTDINKLGNDDLGDLVDFAAQLP